ncbi:lipoprotein [Spiroplasma floricola]|uniref:Lipoprotein n=1 Tax=Spiroplasma floricola 23-6 TaxID=1336749 RepID=A0A2K8SEA9_9MOLU|nr:lipoprotein [Spiroplasma floricola]AUB31762.1 hypothetical protein SFLOR_v1c07140 [Spiroplasma floricola 23-6]
MKKLLSVLATVGVISSSVTGVVACGAKKETPKVEKPEEPKQDIAQVVQKFEQDVTKIYSEHIKIEVLQNLIGLQETEKNYSFIKKDNILKFSNKETEITAKNKNEINSDESKILKLDLLAEKLNELKKVNEYKVILDSVDSVYNNFQVIFDNNFKIRSGVINQDAYIGNFINDYKITVNYKGINDIEKYEIKDTFKYTSTESQAFKLSSDNLIKNVEKDILFSNEMKEFSNIEWQQVKKDNDQLYMGYSDLITRSEYGDNFYNKSENKLKIINFIKENYFKNFENLKMDFTKDKSLITDSSSEISLAMLFEKKDVNKFTTFNDNSSSEKIFKTIFRTNAESSESKKTLKDLYFNDKNMTQWNTEFLSLKDEYIKNRKFTKEQLETINKSSAYINADLISQANVKNLSILIGSGENEYKHELPNFNFLFTYNVTSNLSQKVDLINDYTLKELIGNFHKVYGIDTEYKYPDFNSDEDYLMNIGNKEIIESIKKGVYKSFDNGNVSHMFHRFVNDQIENSKAKKIFELSKLWNTIGSISYNYYIFDNSIDNLFNYKYSSNNGIKNNKLDYKLENDGLNLNPAVSGEKNRESDSITFKLGYLAVNFKYEKLFKLKDGQKTKIFVKFI